MFLKSAPRGLSPLHAQKELKCSAPFAFLPNIGLSAARNLCLFQSQIVTFVVFVERQIIIIIFVHAKQDLSPT